MQWIQSILGLRPTTTTEAPPPAQAEDCPECTRCGVAKNGTKIVGEKDSKNGIFISLNFMLVKCDSTRISGGSETGVNQYPWMGMKSIKNKLFY